MKIPCIECDSKLWEYIKPYLEKWGYTFKHITEKNWKKYPVLVINIASDLGLCGNIGSYSGRYDRELTNNVEEFLEQAAKLKGFIYERKDVTKIHDIEIKPGIGICVDSKYDNNKFYTVIPTKLGLAVVNYGQSCYWLHLDSFLSQYKNRIVAICDLATQSSIRGDFLWVAPEEIVLTMDDIAKKFGYPAERIKIVK